eukprot:811421_1
MNMITFTTSLSLIVTFSAVILIFAFYYTYSTSISLHDNSAHEHNEAHHHLLPTLNYHRADTCYEWEYKNRKSLKNNINKTAWCKVASIDARCHDLYNLLSIDGN